MFPIKEFEKRFREILDALDAINEEQGSEDMDELNAVFEDALFVIESIEPEDEDWREAFSDALAEFKDLRDGYRALNTPELVAEAERLDRLIVMAERNLPEG